MEMNLQSDVIAGLREIATVPVVVDRDVVGNPPMGSIVIESRKLYEIIVSYDDICAVSHKCWSNLPDSPVAEPAHVFMWMISCRDYDVNHSTLRWPGSTPNTFVHLWSILDRMKPSLTSMDMTWLMGTRTCVDYCTSTGMDGPMDAKMYARENVVPSLIENVGSDPGVFMYEPVHRDFDSYMDFQMSTIMQGDEEVLNVSKLVEQRSRIKPSIT